MCQTVAEWSENSTRLQRAYLQLSNFESNMIGNNEQPGGLTARAESGHGAARRDNQTAGL